MKYILRIYTSTETSNQPLPEVVLSRLRDAKRKINFNVNFEARIIPERKRINRPKHERIFAEFETDDEDAEQAIVDELEQNVIHDTEWYVVYNENQDKLAEKGDVPSAL